MGFLGRSLHFIKGKTGNPENRGRKQFSPGPWFKVMSTVTPGLKDRAQGSLQTSLVCQLPTEAWSCGDKQAFLLGVWESQGLWKQEEQTQESAKAGKKGGVWPLSPACWGLVPAWHPLSCLSSGVNVCLPDSWPQACGDRGLRPQRC